ncbi:MAG: GAF domain-containing protein [Bacteroidetes bacterium]|nr:GAF domain-containing protein [Bacteroidota bacterium]
MSNMASLLFWSLRDVNWVGFYLSDGARLCLGPFHGRPACTVLDPDRGVCSAAVRERKTMNIPDVEAFPGHIACDAASRSELVVPLILGGEVWGVLDVDSPHPDRFDAETQHLLERAAAILVSRLGDGIVFPS